MSRRNRRRGRGRRIRHPNPHFNYGLQEIPRPPSRPNRPLKYVAFMVLGILVLAAAIALGLEPVRTYALNFAPGMVSAIDSVTNANQPVVALPVLPTRTPTPRPPPPTRPPRPTAKPAPPPPTIEDIEEITFVLINEQRAAHGVLPLERVEKLMLISRSHSEDMAKRDYYAHKSPEGYNATNRGIGKGYYCRKDLGGGYFSEGLGENIYWGSRTHNRYTSEDFAQRAVKSWMGSKGHRENILDPAYSETGIGVAWALGKVLFTQTFC